MLQNSEFQLCESVQSTIPHPPWPLLISDVGLELEGTLINCSLLHILWSGLQASQIGFCLTGSISLIFLKAVA